jgi:hypothetical protein
LMMEFRGVFQGAIGRWIGCQKFIQVGLGEGCLAAAEAA